MIKKGKDLEIGDVITKPHSSIVIDLDKEGKDPFWCGEPSYTLYDLNDSYYGPGSGELDLEKEFEVATDRKTILRAYNIVECDLAKYIADALERKRELSDIHMKILMGINNRDKE